MPKKKLQLSDRESRLLEAMRANPALMERFESIMALAEGEVDGRIRTADEVEELLMQEIRRLGQQTLGTWAGNVEDALAQKVKKRPGMQMREKKSSGGGAPTERSK